MADEALQITQEKHLAWLRSLRAALLQLHKDVVAYDRLGYERLYGPVGSGRFVQILIEEPWFRWLDPLSRLIIEIDEELESDVQLDETCRAIANSTERLFAPVGDNVESEFCRRYKQSLQGDPQVVLSHGQLLSVIKAFKSLD